jgi:hypothetical protein
MHDAPLCNILGFVVFPRQAEAKTTQRMCDQTCIEVSEQHVAKVFGTIKPLKT